MLAAKNLSAALKQRWIMTNKYSWWLSNYGGDYTESGMWTQSSVQSYMLWGIVFVTVGILGVIGGLILWFKGLPSVAEDNRAYLRKVLLPIAIIGIFAGAIVGGIMLLFVYLMYSDDRYDFFGLLLEDVTRAKRKAPTPVGATPTPDGRDMYAAGYQQQSSLYSDDYAQAAYGGGAGAYTAGAGQSLVDTPAPAPAPAPAAAPPTAPACKSCGKPTEWIEEYGRYYCYDCDAYV